MIDMLPRFAVGCGVVWRVIAGCVALGCLLAIVACSGDEERSYVEKPVEDLYNEALDSLEADQFAIAAQQFDEVERQHPYSTWASKALLMGAYSYYLDNKYDEAAATVTRFIQLHPGNPDIAYAYYLRALCNYERISDVVRDQGMTEWALTSLMEVVTRFPNTAYARDALLKIDLARDHLAGAEMEVGRWYLARGQFLAAINRFRTVLEEYETTTHTPEALHRLVESYLSLGVVEEAQMAAAVLGHNFPGSDWYQDSYGLLAESGVEPARQNESWLDSLWGAIF